MKKIILIVFLFILGLKSFGQQRGTEFYGTDTLKIKKKVQIIALPVVFYTPETQFGFGAGLQTFFLTQTNIYNSRESNTMFDIIYTTEKQFILDVIPKIYFNFGNLFFDGSFKYKVFPNSFWGIGNNTSDENLERYNMRSIMFKAAILQRLPPDLNFGFQYQYEKHTMLELDSAGQLIREDIPGSSGATINGISFVFNLDNRDNVYSTRSGNFMQLTAGFSSKVIGATYSYNKYIIDLRKYFPLGKKSAIASQIYLENTFGDSPFQTKAYLGGGERMRGFFRGRYIDNHMYVVQAEYRNHFSSRWIVAAFGALSEVASLPRYFFDDIKYSVGGGIRFQIVKSNPTLLRLDIGFGKGGNSGVYFGVNEAF